MRKAINSFLGKVLRWEYIAVYILFFAAGGYASSVSLRDTHRTSLEEVHKEFNKLVSTHNEYVEEFNHVNYVYLTSIEYKFDPLLVGAFYNEARKLTYPEDTEWTRYVNNPRVLTARMLDIVRNESAGKHDAIGDGGKALGPTQMWLTTAKKYKKDLTREELLELGIHSRVAVAHFVDLLKRYNGNDILAFLAWNRGQRRIDELIGMRESPANGYVAKILARARRANGIHIN